MAEHEDVDYSPEPRIDVVDISAFVDDTTRLQRKLQILAYLWIATDYILRWKTPWISVLVLLGAETICMWPSLLPFIILLAVGCLFIRKFLPIPMEKHLSFHYPAAPATPVNEDDMTLAEQDAAIRQRSEELYQYRRSLAIVHSHMRTTLIGFREIDKLLLWEDKALTRRWLIWLLIHLIAMILLPWQSICGASLAVLFLNNSSFFAMFKRKSEPEMCDDSSTSDVDESDGLEDEPNLVGSTQASADHEQSYSFSDDEEDYNTAAGIRVASSKPSVVSRIRAIRQRRKLAKDMSCADCKTSLSGLLRKRCYCRRCGQDFCANCCYKEVRRALLGATAPAAQRETVLVCNCCHDDLMHTGEVEQRSQTEQRRSRSNISAESGQSVTS